MPTITDLTELFQQNKQLQSKELYILVPYLLSTVSYILRQKYDNAIIQSILSTLIIIIQLSLKICNKLHQFKALSDFVIIGQESLQMLQLFKSNEVLDNILEKDSTNHQQRNDMISISIALFSIQIIVPFILNYRISLIYRNITQVIQSVYYSKQIHDKPLNIFSSLVSALIINLNISFIILNIVFVIVDIKQEDEFKLKEKQEISMMKVIHDLKNPFCSINEMVKDKESSIEKVFANILSESNDGLNMLENLKMYFKMSHGMEINETPQNVDIQDYIENMRFTHTKLASLNDDKLILNHPKQIPVNIKIHSVLVKRILNNFISNAIKHTLGGIISISQDIVDRINHETGFIEIKNNILKEKGRQIRFEVKDNGKGISEENIHTIFENKVSDQSGSNWDGTGLGLPICSNISSKLNSQIHQKSTDNKGSVFVFQQSIPFLNDQNIIYKHHQVNENHYNNHKIKKFYHNENSIHTCFEILVAEDNIGIIKSQKRQFDKHNIVYKLFTNGSSCYNQICKNKCNNCSSILFTDNQMPQKSGIELAIEIRKLNMNMKIIMISADDIDDNQNLFDAIYPKPMISKVFLKQQSENITQNCIKIIK